MNEKLTNFRKAIPLMGVVLGMFLLSCQDRVEVTREYTVYEPVYLSLNDIRTGLDVSAPRPIVERGGILLYENWILINEPGNGIHVVDNTVPSSPVARQFIELPGNYSFSVRNGLLYADSYIDLAVIDITDMNEVKEVNRLEGIFENFNDEYVLDADSGLIISYEPRRTVSVTIEEVGGHFDNVFSGGFFGMDDHVRFAAVSTPESQLPQNNTGTGGSMATYSIVNNYLYALDDSSLHTFDLSNEDEPVKTGELMLGWDIETLFPYGENLFVGAQAGMYIIDNSTPSNPDLITIYSHVVSCDPVVVQGDRAYVTLRSGTNCGGALNQLEVIDISNLSNPTLIREYPMSNPHGLGIDGSTLFICEGESGLKVFDAADDLKISQNMIDQITNLDAFDVIPLNNTLYLIGSDGLYQYDYTDPKDLKFISKLEMFTSEL